MTGLFAEHPDVADYIGRALVDGSPLGTMIFDTLLAVGTARWQQRAERGETRPDVDLTWAAINSLVLALGTIILRDAYRPAPAGAVHHTRSASALAGRSELPAARRSVPTLAPTESRGVNPVRRQPFCGTWTVSHRRTGRRRG